MAAGEMIVEASSEDNLSSLSVNSLAVIIKARKVANSNALKQKEYDRQSNIFYNSINIGADYFEATGNLPDKIALRRLYETTYSDYSPEEILDSGVFHGWEDYLSFVEQKRADDLVRVESWREAVLSEIQGGMERGEIPFILAAKIDRFRSSPKAQHNNRARLAGDLAEDEEIVKRYAKYLIACELVEDRDSDNGRAPRKQDTNLRRLNIAMGINVESGKILNHTFVYEILHSSERLHTKEDVVESAIYQEWFNMLYPEDRKKYLQEVSDAGRKPEYYYDPRSAELIMFIGETTVVGSKKIRKSKKLITLAQALLDENSDYTNFAMKNRYRYQSWERSDYRKYGQMLIDVLEPYDTELDMAILRKASRLGVGPGERTIRDVYGGYLNYFNELGIKKRQGQFIDWVEEDFVTHIKKIASEVGGKVTEEMLWDRIHDGAEEPSPRLMKSRTGKTFSGLLESAELPARNRGLSTEDCVLLGTRYADEHGGKIPRKKDLESIWYLPSSFFIREMFGNLTSYQKLVRDCLIGADTKE